MVTFIIIRHGYSQFNKEKRFTGQLNIPLDEIGISQAEATAKYVLENFNIDAIYSSDLNRAYNTAKPIADALKLPIITQKNLREINLGYWQGKTPVQVQEEFPETYKIHTETPGLTIFDGGESYMEARKRAAKAISEIAEENDGKTVVVAAHGGIIRSLLWEWNQLGDVSETVNIPNASVTVVNYDKGKVDFLLSGYDKHLDVKTPEIKVY